MASDTEMLSRPSLPSFLKRNDTSHTLMNQQNQLRESVSDLGPRRHHPQLTVAVDMLTDVRNRKSMKGGEGVRKLVKERESAPAWWGGQRNDYWVPSLLATKGRALPTIPLLVYSIYSAAIVVALVLGLDDYTTKRELSGLQFLSGTLGAALFFLLAFRTNSCYERWWEGCKLWEGIQSKCQDQGRLATAWLGEKDPEVTSSLIRWTIAFVIVAKQALRFDNTYDELNKVLTDRELQELKAANNPATFVAHGMTKAIGRLAVPDGPVPVPIYAGMDNNCKGLVCDLNACLRIVNTPMPFAYIVHLRSFMILWLAGLPFAFVQTMGYWAIVVCVIIGYQLLGFEDIGVEIESPFGYDYNDLPIDQIATDIANSLLDLLARLPATEAALVKTVSGIPSTKVPPVTSASNYKWSPDTPDVSGMEAV